MVYDFSLMVYGVVISVIAMNFMVIGNTITVGDILEVVYESAYLVSVNLMQVFFV